MLWKNRTYEGDAGGGSRLADMWRPDGDRRNSERPRSLGVQDENGHQVVRAARFSVVPAALSVSVNFTAA